MATLRCTKKLLSELNNKSLDDRESPDDVGGWHANLLRIDRRKCILFTHDKSLYSFFVPGLTKPYFQKFEEVFRQNLFRNLVAENLPQKYIEILLDDVRKIKICKTNNRSVLGSMNDLTVQLKYQVADQGGLVNADIQKLNHELNRIPMGAIDEIFSIYELKKLLEKING